MMKFSWFGFAPNCRRRLPYRMAMVKATFAELKAAEGDYEEFDMWTAVAVQARATST